MTFCPIDEDDAASLLALARMGDAPAFSRLMEKEQGRLLAQAQVFCADAHLAQHLVQETMIAAWKTMHRLDGSCRLFTWLYVILLRQHRRSLGWFARRLPLATLEQQATVQRHEPSVWESDKEAIAVEGELLRKMLLTLPAKHGEIIRLRFYVQASEAEIAAVLDVPLGTVKSRLHHALENLRRMKEKMNLLRDGMH